ncbi:hypothetical protein BDD12DRAFT_432178 [Trichophaea hybrida]|nr:hypothetical protein BDD12DRAFT_432178 [Trichophaea hybrida]
MNDIRNRFVFEFYDKRWCIEGAERIEALSPIIKEALSSSQTAWVSALRALEDIRTGKKSSLGRTAALLVLSSVMDSRINETSDDILWQFGKFLYTRPFYGALHQWMDSQGHELNEFTNFWWPDLVEHRRDYQRSIECGNLHYFSLRCSDWYFSDETLQQHIERLNTIFGEAPSNNLPITRMILTNFMEEDNFQISTDNLAVEAMAVTLTFEEPRNSHPDPCHGDATLAGGREQNSKGGTTNPSGVDLTEAAIFVGIIVWFLNQIHIPGLTPLLLLVVAVQLGRYNFVAYTLETYAAVFSLDPTYSFVQENWFQDIVEGICDDAYQTLEEVRMDMIRMVSISAIEAVLSFCALCASHLHKFGFSDISPLQQCHGSFRPVSTDHKGFENDKEDLLSTADVITEHTEVPEAENPSAVNSLSPSNTTSITHNSPTIVSTVPSQHRPNHACIHCKMIFPTSSNRRRHEKSVHGGTIACRHCDKPIRDRADYKKKHANVCKALSRAEF